MRDNRSMPANSIIPVLAYSDVREAVAWLCGVFGFKERLRIAEHRSQLEFGDGAVVVTTSDDSASSSASADSIMVRVANVDSHFAHAQDAGAIVISFPASFPFGERQYTARDIGGHVWTFSETTENVDPSTWGGVFLVGEDRGK
jgi:uncharacterized glyoxalase superfamily protein PhnB